MSNEKGSAVRGAFPASFALLYFTCCDADSAEYSAFHACRYACDDSAEYNGVSRLGRPGGDVQQLILRMPSYSPPFRVATVHISASEAQRFLLLRLLATLGR